MQQLPVRLSHLSFSYGARVALNKIDLSVKPGEIAVLAGPNGSGKTTLLKILAGLLTRDSGEIDIFGMNPQTQRMEIMKDTRFAFAPPALYPALTAWEHLSAMAKLSTPKKNQFSDKELMTNLELVGLEKRAHDRTSDYSFGMRQRLALAMAITPTPKLLVLDEPTEGLDPLAVLEFRDILRRLREERGVTILLSSHLLVKLEELADVLLVLHEGSTLFYGKPSDLIDASGTLQITVAGDPSKAQDDLDTAGFSTIIDGGRLRFTEKEPSLTQTVNILGSSLQEYTRHRPNLEDALLTRLAMAKKEAH